jgi:hypothetical protein
MAKSSKLFEHFFSQLFDWYVYVSLTTLLDNCMCLTVTNDALRIPCDLLTVTVDLSMNNKTQPIFDILQIRQLFHRNGSL